MHAQTKADIAFIAVMAFAIAVVFAFPRSSIEAKEVFDMDCACACFTWNDSPGATNE